MGAAAGALRHTCVPPLSFLSLFFSFLKIFGASKGNGVPFLKGLLGVEKEE